MNLEVKRSWGWGRSRGPVKGLSLSVPAPLTYTTRTEKSESSFKGPLCLKQCCLESIMVK